MAIPFNSRNIVPIKSIGNCHLLVTFIERRSDMTTGSEETPSHPPFPVDAANRLLDLLSNDDAFRTLFMDNLASALAQIGLNASEIQAATVSPTCLTATKLASKQEIAESRAALLEQLIGVAPHTHVFCFEAAATN
jgi:putative modified peptide